MTFSMDIMLQRIVRLIGSKHGAKKALADHLGISQNVITAWLSNSPNMKSQSYKKYAPQIAEYFGVSLDYLAGNENAKKPATISDDGLSPERQKLIDLLKGLSPEDAIRAEGYLRGLIDAHKQ